MHESTKKRMLHIGEEVLSKFEPGNQRKSIANIWRLEIYPKYGISYSTLMRYLTIKIERAKQ